MHRATGMVGGRPAWLMQADTAQAGYQLIDRNYPGPTAMVSEDIRLGDLCASTLHNCETDAAQKEEPECCTLGVQPRQ